MKTEVFQVSGEDAGKRLDVVLARRFPSSSRALCRAAVASGGVKVNGKPCTGKGCKLREGDAVSVEGLLEAVDNRVQADASVQPDILFLDDALVAVNKPAGIPVQPLSCTERGTLMNGLVARFPELADIGDAPLMAGALHRIDIWTSGLVLAARTQEAFDAMRRQFAARAVAKTYLALVDGSVETPGSLRHELAHDPDSSCCRMVDAATLARPDRRMAAVTEYRPLKQVGPWTLLEVEIHTGVTHQIRCQLALNGTPIVGDALYGKARHDTPRHFLHAASIRFRHPVTGGECRLDAPLPPDFTDFLEAGA